MLTSRSDWRTTVIAVGITGLAIAASYPFGLWGMAVVYLSFLTLYPSALMCIVVHRLMHEDGEWRSYTSWVERWEMRCGLWWHGMKFLARLTWSRQARAELRDLRQRTSEQLDVDQ